MEWLGVDPQDKKPVKMHKGDWDEKIKDKFGACGENVFIGHGCVFPTPHKIFLDSNVRIDPFCLITCELHVGAYSQIMAHSVISGGISPKGTETPHIVKLHGGNFIGYGSKLFTASEDYSGEYGMIGDQWFENKIHRESIEFAFYAGVASDVIVMPGVKLPEGCAIGAKSFVYSDKFLDPWCLFYGNPLKFKGKRKQTRATVKGKW